MTQKTTLYVVRHGNTFGPDDVVTRVGGRTDLPLVESGLNQGTKLGEYFKQQNIAPDMIFTSSLQRTIQTAAQAQKAMGTNIPTEIASTFNEIDYGIDENQPEEIVRARLGDQAIEDWDQYCIVPDGWLVDVDGLRQAWRDFGTRVATEFSGKTVVIVTHNGVARFVSELLDGGSLGDDPAENVKLKTGAFGRFEHDGASWRCAEWNTRPEKLLQSELSASAAKNDGSKDGVKPKNMSF